MPEIILDQGLGDLFDVRVAGDIASDTELASIEYAAAQSGEAEGHLPSLLNLIRPAIDRAKGQPGDLIDNAVRINVENVVRQIRGSTPVLAPLVNRGQLSVVGAVYSLDTGKVAWLPDGQAKMAAWLEPPGASAQCAVTRH